MLERVWIGSVASDHEDEHEEFVAWLASDAGARMFRQYRLHSYELQQIGQQLVVTMRAAEPPIIIHFLRNPRAWPDFWEFKSNTLDDAPSQTELRVQWYETKEAER
jgi:hypothetical protein